MHDGLEDSILGRPLRCYKSITVDDEEEWHRSKIIIAHQAHKNTNCSTYTNTIEVTFKYKKHHTHNIELLLILIHNVSLETSL